ncbi:NUDIX hydrolase [Crocinitomicaceae bacterium]|nr:NUDIX hydrolase [Crocinitomicaceae bacterium]MDC0257922.1 NUDIX hydrolase [Crocinitomicaceae bacterium]
MSYKIKFDHFFSYSFSLDCAIFGYKDGKIHVLLIKRAMEPYSGEWAIPGNLVYPDEDLPIAASRILSELTKLTNVELHQGQTFGNPNRHPQGRVITCAYFALVRIDDLVAEADSWAEEVLWAPMHEVPSLAFDHKEIVESTYADLRRKLQYEPICFDLLPEKFTLNEMQQLYEYAYNVDMDKANFRKKIKSIPLIHLEEKQKNVKHRPANLFSFDADRYKQLVEEENYLFRM